MMTPPHILVASTKVDAATDEVVRLLIDHGVRVTRFNTEDYPFKSTLSTIYSQSPNKVTTTVNLPLCNRVSLGDVTALWYRRVRSAERPEEMDQGVYEFCLREARASLLGSVLAMGARSMSPPENVWAAEYKPYQLATAMSAGMKIPETVITNDPDDVVDAFKRFGQQMIVKPCRTGYVEYGAERYAIYTSQVLEEHLSKVHTVQFSPSIYQPLLQKKSDVRVTVVGNKMFAAEIDSQSDPAAVVDWRRTENPKLPHREGLLPCEIEKRVKRLLRTLGLNFAAVDLIRTTDDEYVFLEVNPSGQWLWLDDMLGFGISESVANWLCGAQE